ncbi:MAG: ATP-binding protein [Acidobacteriia bacterium]|nr:ATP-binding protein [Terriglobia bacterium]
MRKFNLEGPVEAERHYCIPPLSRVNLAEILELIADRRYFVLYAPRQTGKTSILLALQDRLNAGSEYRCVYVNVEGCQEAGEDTARATRTLLADLASRSFEVLRDDFVESTMSEHLEKYGPGAALGQTLVRWSATSQVPLVLLIDEIDTLVGDSLISVLRQLRANYDRRPSHFPQSVILCGVRDVRDYQIYSSRQGTNVKGGSAFNIKAESLRLGDFSRGEVRDLLAQYTAERGQAFEAGAIERIWALTCGQPWLVNALAYEACFKGEAGGESSRPIRADAIEQAKDGLILKRVTHLHQLADKLREDRVRRVILPMLAGSEDWDYSVRDLEYVRDLGLVASEGEVRIANPIYAEVVPRELTTVLQSGLETQVDPAWYVDADGSLDVAGLLSAFQGYFRENSESWVERYGHAEAGPQLVLHAYLQRVVNSGGRIGREYAVGRGRTDLLLEWRQIVRGQVQIRKYVIECKVRTERVGLERLIREGREQTAAYMDKCGAEAGHLVIFDLRPGLSWEERLFQKDPKPGESPVTVWGL